MADLILHVKDCYFQDIKAGRKPKEYRKRTPYWKKRLEGRTYDEVIICSGYPKLDDPDRVITLPWRGYEEETITHEHFGNVAEDVYAINVDVRTK